MKNLISLKVGLQARIVRVANDSNDKLLKQLVNMGIVKGNVIEVVNSEMPGLLLLKKENSVFGISKELAKNIFIKII